MIPQLFLSVLSVLSLLLLTHLLLLPSSPTSPFPRYPNNPNNNKDRLLSPDPAKPRLRLNEQGGFRIAVFSDLHYGEDEATFGAAQDEKSTGVIGKVLGMEGGVDFVVFDGDFITGENTHKENATKYIHQIVSPLVATNMSWASTYGNHDTQFNLSREKLFREETAYDLSYTQHGPEGVGGVTNYWLPIYAHKNSTSTLATNLNSSSGQKVPSLKNQEEQQQQGEEETPIMILYFFDSQGGEQYQVPRWNFWGGRWMPNWVEKSAVKNFIAQRTLIESHFGVLPSLAFVHIPPTSFLFLQKEKFPGRGEKDVHYPGLNDDVPVANQGEGRWGRVRDREFMDALLGTRGLHSVYSGHDHGNSWCGNWPGDRPAAGKSVGGQRGDIDEGEEADPEAWKSAKPKICFVKHTGYGGYGTWRRGSRILDLTFRDPVIASTSATRGGSIRSPNAQVMRSANKQRAVGDGRGEDKKKNKKMEVESWVRLEEGDIVQRVSLNETYGIDVYPTDDGEEGSG